MIIQLATVSHTSEATDYWDDVQEDSFELSRGTKHIYTKEFDSIDDCWDECDKMDVIVSKKNVYAEGVPDYIDCCVKVYDGYNE